MKHSKAKMNRSDSGKLRGERRQAGDTNVVFARNSSHMLCNLLTKPSLMHPLTSFLLEKHKKL